MSATAGKYVTRSPRYVFKPLDSTFMRFAPLEVRGTINPASVLDLSDTGLAFVLEGDDAPEEGEIIKVEFTVPGRKTIACFARVTRKETIGNDVAAAWGPSVTSPSKTKVAIRFKGLPEGHRRALRLSLQDRVRINPHDGDEAQLDPQAVDALRDPKLRTVLVIAGGCAVLVALFHLMTISPAELLRLLF